MRSVAGWIGALWLVTGCTVPSDVAKTCTADTDCGQGGSCDVSVGLCYATGTEQPVDPSACSPACPDYQVCTQKGCADRFTGLTILTPAANELVGGGPVEVRAQLHGNPVYEGTTRYPDTLVLTATREDGASDSGSFGVVTRNGDLYTVQWTPPSGQTLVNLTAAHPIPAAVPSASVTVQLDTRAPTFTIAFSNPPPRAPGTVGAQADERDPVSGFDTAFRRDESVTVTVSADEAVSGVTMTVVGIGTGGNPGQEMPPVAVQPASSCGGSPPFCGAVTVDLSTPEMRDVRGSMGFRVDGKDAANNPGTKTASLKVTRWKWAFDAAAPIKASPVLGEKGSVYFGTAIATGKVFRLEPDGMKQWDVDVESVDGSPAVGAFSTGTELVYVSSNFTGLPVLGSGTRLRAIDGVSGSVLNTPCAYSVSSGTPPTVSNSAAVTTTSIGGTAVETGLFIVSKNHKSAVGLRPTSVGATTMWCVDSDNSQSMPDATPTGGLAANNAGQFAYPTDSKRIAMYAFGNSAALWTANPGGGVGQRLFGVALLGNTVLGSGGTDFDQGGLFQIPADSTGTPTVNALTGTVNGRIYQFAASGDGTLYYGRESTSPGTQLAKYNLLGSAVSKSVDGAGVLVAAPVLGSDGKVYTVNSTGELGVWTSDLTSLWKLSNIGAVDASPTLDCSRGVDGSPRGATAPGVLYVAAGNKLHAFIIDSPRMPKEANSWPKFQHDARNTGNPATPITNCP